MKCHKLIYKSVHGNDLHVHCAAFPVYSTGVHSTGVHANGAALPVYITARAQY